MIVEASELEWRRDLLAKGLETLNERERHIVKGRRLRDEAMTLADLGHIYGVSRERVRQIEVRAFGKLQKAMLTAAANQPSSSHQFVPEKPRRCAATISASSSRASPVADGARRSHDAEVADSDCDHSGEIELPQGPIAAAKRPERFLVGSEDLDLVRVVVGDAEVACLVEVQRRGSLRAHFEVGQRSRKLRSASAIWRSTRGVRMAPRAGSLARAERPSDVAAKDTSACSSLASNRSTMALMA